MGLRIGYLLFALSLVGAGFYFVPDEKNTSNKNELLTKAEVETEKPEPKAEKSKEKIEPKKIVPPMSNDKMYNIKKAQAFDDAFEYVDMEEMKTKRKPKPRVEPIGAYTFKKNSIKELYVNDTLTLPEVRDTEYTVKVKTKVVNPNGSIGIKASVEGQDSEYYAVMTEGDKTAFVTLYTKEGVFEFESVNGNGYVYSSSDMRNAMIDFDKTDSVKVQK
jgi:hypothetical protein